MTPIPLRSILKPDRGYVCLSCLLKQQGIRPRRGLRFQSTTTHSATSSTTDSGFAVEGGALKHLKTKSSEGGLLSNVDAKPHPHKTEDQSGKKDGGKGKEGQQIVRVHVGGSQADGQTKKKKRKKVKKGTRPASKAQNGTQQDTKGTEQVTDAGDPSTSGKLEGVETKDQATGNGRRRPTRVMHIRREVVLPSRPRIRKLLSSIAFTITKVEGPGPGSDGQQERGITIGHQIRGSYNKVVDSEQKVAALKSLAAKRPQEEQDQNSASSTNPKPIISGQISTGSTMTTATTGAKDVLEPSKKKKQKSKERFSVENGEKSSVLGSLRAVVEAQKQTLKAKDKEEKVLESKAKGRKKASTAGNDGKGMHPETDQTVRSCTNRITC